jgi:hypothetical protein
MHMTVDSESLYVIQVRYNENQMTLMKSYTGEMLVETMSDIEVSDHSGYPRAFDICLVCEMRHT